MTDNAGGGLDGTATVRSLRIVQKLRNVTMHLAGVRYYTRKRPLVAAALKET